MLLCLAVLCFAGLCCRAIFCCSYCRCLPAIDAAVPAAAVPSACVCACCHCCCLAHHAHARACPQALQVHATLCALGVPCQLEHTEAGEYSIDIALSDHRISGGWPAGALGARWGGLQRGTVFATPASAGTDAVADVVTGLKW
jgi:hypothetical protein